MKKSNSYLSSFILIIMLYPAISLGQNENMKEFENFVADKNKETVYKNDSINKKLNEVKLEKLEVEISLQKYYIESLENRKRAFHWSNISSLIIFWMVIIIVFCGLIFSAVQFYISMLNAKHKVQKPTKTGSGEEEETGITKLKISLSGLEVNSSVLGILILVISLAFFYLYLVHVYPVKEYNLESKSQIEESLSTP